MNSRVLALRRWFTDTISGRLIALGAALKFLAILIRFAVGEVRFVEAVDTAGDIGLVVGGAILLSRLLVDARRAVLWRVRRKLTLSYVFIGVVPALLIIAFFLTCGLLLFFNVSAYVIRGRVGAFLEHTHSIAQAAAFELQDVQSPDELQRILDRRQASTAVRFPLSSYALVPADRACVEAAMPGASMVSAGRIAGGWRHMAPPGSVPAWVPCDGAGALIAYAIPAANGTPARVQLVARGVAWPDVHEPHYAVIVDIPLSGDIARQLREQTGVELGDVAALIAPGTGSPAAGTAGERREGRVIAPGVARGADASATGAGTDVDVTARAITGLWRRPLEWVAFLEVTEWSTGQRETATVAIRTSLADMSARVFATPTGRIGEFSFGQALLILLAVVGGLFLVIQIVAFVMGLGLAQSITGSVHELLVGTERVQRGDFTHRIAIRSRDELGELAGSFNLMTASIEDLLLQQREKQRMEQELRIARRIQMSLLPQVAMSFPGLSLVAHCEPAREVGGDYYDYVRLDEHRLALLIADVSGKGTSAALYMAELKGLIMALSRRHASPRELLVEANRIISHHLDTKSFITITYAIVDSSARTLTYARAGHCPVIYVPGPHAAIRDAQVLLEGGLVLGLQLDNGEMFERLLTDVAVPLATGDLFLFYTDGLTEAMDPDGECFGDDRLSDLVRRHADLPFEQIRERILREIAAFTGSAPQHDDMTMILVRVEDMGTGLGATAA